MLIGFLSIILTLILIILDLSKKIRLSHWSITAIAWIVLPHTVLVFWWLATKVNTLFMIAYCLAVFYLYIRTAIFPWYGKKSPSFRVGVLMGSRKILYTSLWAIAVQIPIVILLLKVKIPSSIMVWNTVVLIVLIFLLAVGGLFRIVCISTRLRIIPRIIIITCWWIPIVNIFLILYACHAVWLEYDHACYKNDIRKVRANSDICRTKYPFLMMHGVGFRDFKYINYWGRIPRELEMNGATLYYGQQEAFGTVVYNAKDIKNRILEIVEQTGCEKVNIIAHSKGGLDARYVISKLDMADYVASLTTMSTPHHGCKFADSAFKKLSDKLYRKIAKLVDKYFRFIGDKNPDFYTACKQFTTDYSIQFNEEVIDAPQVYYQSYGSLMKHAFSDSLLTITYLIIKGIEGENDGLCTPDSVKWGDFKGIIKNKHNRGISHGDMIDLKRQDYKGFDVAELYVKILSELKDKGF